MSERFPSESQLRRTTMAAMALAEALLNDPTDGPGFITMALAVPDLFHELDACGFGDVRIG